MCCSPAPIRRRIPYWRARSWDCLGTLGLRRYPHGVIQFSRFIAYYGEIVGAVIWFPFTYIPYRKRWICPGISNLFEFFEISPQLVGSEITRTGQDFEKNIYPLNRVANENDKNITPFDKIHKSFSYPLTTRCWFFGRILRALPIFVTDFLQNYNLKHQKIYPSNR